MFQKVANWFQGRHTTFCVAFFVTGTGLQFAHRLDMTYVAFMGTLLTAITGRAIGQDYANAKPDNAA
jgi:hypothetical protein